MLADAADDEGQMDLALPCLEIQYHCKLLWKKLERSRAFGLASRIYSSPHSSLAVQPAKPHVAHVHVAMLLTNTFLGVPRHHWVPHCSL